MLRKPELKRKKEQREWNKKHYNKDYDDDSEDYFVEQLKRKKIPHVKYKRQQENKLQM